MPTDTFSISAGGNDGYVYKVSGAYPPSGSVTRDTTDSNVLVERANFSSNYEVMNGLLTFNTSALPDNANISGAVLKIYITNKSSVDSLNLVAEWFVLSGTSSDYTVTPSTSAHSGTSISSLVANIVNQLTLQNYDTGINKTGNTDIRLHITQRASDAAPTGDNSVAISAFEDATPEAQLLVTYSLGGGDLIGAVGV